MEGRIEDISCKDLVDLTNDLYFLILQKLKEKAIELEKLIDKKSSDGHSSNGTVDEGNAGGLEKDMIKARLSGNRAGFRDKSGFLFSGSGYTHFIHITFILVAINSIKIIAQYPSAHHAQPPLGGGEHESCIVTYNTASSHFQYSQPSHQQK